MRILYYSDKYSYNVMGTKRSLFEEIKSRGIDIVWMDKSLINKVLVHVKKYNPTQIWLAGSDITLLFKIQKIPVIAFGFSDPFMFDQSRFQNCDVYVTNHLDTFDRYKNEKAMIYNPTACDFRFHKKLDVPKRFDVTVIGCGNHSRFKNPKERIETVDRLREDGVDVWAFGNNWPKHPKNKPHVEGQDFLNIINSSKIGLDIMEGSFPLAHRMFEYPACGVPIITRARYEVCGFFSMPEEMRTYMDYEDLKLHIESLLRSPAIVGQKALERCKKGHNISNRVDHLLSKLKVWL